MSLIYPRLEKKAHGSGARVEGVWKAGDVAVMLDDLITTGGSKREAAAVLREAGLDVRDLVVLIERGDEGRRDMAEAGISLRAWARVEDLLEAGSDAGYLDRDMARRVMDFTRKG
jgi:uridine monophosphate synthetase